MVGLDANYLRKQLNDFASGARDNAVMQPIAKALSEDERKALADYYVRMPVPAGAAKPQGRPMPARESRGAVLASRRCISPSNSEPGSKARAVTTRWS